MAFKNDFELVRPIFLYHSKLEYNYAFLFSCLCQVPEVYIAQFAKDE